MCHLFRLDLGKISDWNWSGLRWIFVTLGELMWEEFQRNIPNLKILKLQVVSSGTSLRPAKFRKGSGTYLKDYSDLKGTRKESLTVNAFLVCGNQERVVVIFLKYSFKSKKDSDWNWSWNQLKRICKKCVKPLDNENFQPNLGCGLRTKHIFWKVFE